MIEALAVSAYNRVLYWHPSFNIYTLANLDLVLLSADQQLCLPQTHYPLLRYINNQRTVIDILNQSPNLNMQQQTQFIAQLETLFDKGILLDQVPRQTFRTPRFREPSRPAVPQMLNSSLAMVVLTEMAESLLAPLAAHLSRQHDKILGDVTHGATSYRIVVVDDFLDPRINTLDCPANTIVLKISGPQFWLSPLFSAIEMTHFDQLQSVLLDNQPVRKYLMALFPDAHHGDPIATDSVITAQEVEVIADLVTRQLRTQTTPQILIHNRDQQHTQAHGMPFTLSHDAQGLCQPLDTPVPMVRRNYTLSMDGGTRCIPAAETVTQLMPLVSPITGLINHLTELDSQQASAPVKTYRSGYFKCPHPLAIKDGAQFPDFVQICLGKGVDPLQSQASALAEAIERCNARYRDDIKAVTATKSDWLKADARCVDFLELAPYSDHQYQHFQETSGAGLPHHTPSQRYTNQPVHWLPTWSLTHQQFVQVPLSLCFSHTPYDDERFGRWQSNGCAAGNSVEEAVLQGLFELIERDAAALWWYNQAPRPEFNIDRLAPSHRHKLQATLQQTTDASPHGHDFWVLDLTHDIGVPVMVAVARRKQLGGWTLGFGCHLQAEIAAQRALTELCQLIPIRDQHAAPFDFDAIATAPYLFPCADAAQSKPALPPSMDIQLDIANLVDRLAEQGMETLVLNYSRRHIPLATVKVFVPGLCTMWPQLGNPRLYQVPAQLGWVKRPLREDQLHPQPLYI